MTKTAFKGNPVSLAGEFIKTGAQAPAFTLVKNDLSNFSLDDARGKFVLLNIFPSLDTGVCATSVRNSTRWLLKCLTHLFWPYPKTFLSHRDGSAPQKGSAT